MAAYVINSDNGLSLEREGDTFYFRWRGRGGGMRVSYKAMSTFINACFNSDRDVKIIEDGTILERIYYPWFMGGSKARLRCYGDELDLSYNALRDAYLAVR